MENIHQQVVDRKFPDVSFMIVNGKKAASYKYKLDEIVSFPVYQESSKTGKIWETLGGGKDDFFVYDRCGRLVEYIPVQKIYVNYYTTRIVNAFNTAYLDKGCKGPCEEPTTTAFTKNSTEVTETTTTVPTTEEKATGVEDKLKVDRKKETEGEEEEVNKNDEN